MAYKERTNPKTNEKEYKVRYYFMKDGKRRDSETAWFNSLEKAEAEAKRMKNEKEKADRHRRLERRDKLLITVFEEYIEELKEIKNRQNTTTDGKLYSTASAIKNKHMPASIQNVKIKDLETLTFKAWHSHINSKDSISGEYIRICRAVLFKFNEWMADHNYYNDDYLEENIRNAISNSKIKKKSYNNREDNGERNIITIVDIKKIADYYFKNGIEEFENFYYYTLFYVLFFSGVRVEELCALQWKAIDLKESNRIISIVNAISEKEQREHALTRTYNEIYRTKNTTSVRMIPIFDYYYGLLLDYKESYKYEYDLDDEEIEECFVFPHLSKKHNPRVCMKSPMVRKELQRTTEKIGMKKTDLQMFRHSCATFLILPPPDGLGYSDEKVKDYFGHQDTSMLNRVYAKLTTIQKRDRMRQTFSDIYKPNEKDSMDAEEQLKRKLLARISGNDKAAYIARKNRIYKQIDKSISNNRKQYYYNLRDKDIIERYIKERGDNKIEFICTD